MRRNCLLRTVERRPSTTVWTFGPELLSENTCLLKLKTERNRKLEKLAEKKKELQLLAAQNGARTNLAENVPVSQNEQESIAFQNELGQELSSRTPTPELYDTAKLLADKDREIEELKKDREELLKERPISNSGILFLPEDLAMEIYNAVSSGPITGVGGLNLKHNGKEVTAIHQQASKSTTI